MDARIFDKVRQRPSRRSTAGRERVASSDARGGVFCADLLENTECIGGLRQGKAPVASGFCEADYGSLLAVTLIGNGLNHVDCLTVTGRRIAENRAQVTFEIKLRQIRWPRETDHRSGALWEDTQAAGATSNETATRQGGAVETVNYADL